MNGIPGFSGSTPTPWSGRGCRPAQGQGDLGPEPSLPSPDHGIAAGPPAAHGAAVASRPLSPATPTRESRPKAPRRRSPFTQAAARSVPSWEARLSGPAHRLVVGQGVDLQPVQPAQRETVLAEHPRRCRRRSPARGTGAGSTSRCGPAGCAGRSATAAPPRPARRLGSTTEKHATLLGRRPMAYGCFLVSGGTGTQGRLSARTASRRRCRAPPTGPAGPSPDGPAGPRAAWSLAQAYRAGRRRRHWLQLPPTLANRPLDPGPRIARRDRGRPAGRPG